MKIVKIKSYQYLCDYMAFCIDNAPDDDRKAICKKAFQTIQRAHKFAVKETNDENTVDIQRVNSWLGRQAFHAIKQDHKNLYINLMYKIDQMRVSDE